VDLSWWFVTSPSTRAGKGPPGILGYELGDVLEVLRRYVSEDEREDGVGGDLPKRSMRAVEGFRAT